jgi:uncharacterized protein
MSDTQPSQDTGMPCPVCKVGLVMTERQGVEIDYCPKCRGVWLDRGELDKIIERSLGQPNVAPLNPREMLQAGGYPSRDQHRDDHDDDDHRDRGTQGARRKSFFSDLFD